MTFFVDADSCPQRIREIICKTAQRLHVQAVFVANRSIPIPQYSSCCRLEVTAAEDQAADKYILTHANPGDMVITRDIPLAKQLVDAQVRVLNDRGTVYTSENIGERLSLRNLCMSCAQTVFRLNAVRLLERKKLWSLRRLLIVRHNGFCEPLLDSLDTRHNLKKCVGNFRIKFYIA